MLTSTMVGGIMADKELTSRAAEDFLNPDLFKTGMDTDELNKKQYEKGLSISNRSVTVGISANGCWFADLDAGGHMSSYEVIGYHSGTAELLRGLLAGKAQFKVFRLGTDCFTITTIKE